MLRIYLDQKQWVQLAQARTGHPLGQDFLDAYKAVKAAATDGIASFPLSATHYFETHKQGSQQRRLDLAITMTEISHLDAIAPPHVIVPYEIEAALIETFGLDRELPPLRVFGRGANHVHGTDIFTFTAPREF